MVRRCGWLVEARLLKLLRSNMLPVPSQLSRFFEKAYDAVKSRPWEKRFVTLACNASYHVLPSGAHIEPIPEYCGNGRRLCSTVPLSGKLGYGLVKPRATATDDVIEELRRVRSAAF